MYKTNDKFKTIMALSNIRKKSYILSIYSVYSHYIIESLKLKVCGFSLMV